MSWIFGERSAFGRVASGLALGLLLMGAFAGAAQAQPFGSWLSLDGAPQHGYVEIGAWPAFNPGSAFTFEAWVKLTDNAGCSTIAGKDWQQAWWFGICGTTFRSYLRGSGSRFDAGIVPANVWTHVAVVFDGAVRRHYINGVLAGSVAQTDPVASSPDPVRIGSDVSWEFTPAGQIDEVRFWNIARSQAEIQANMNAAIQTPTPGLFAVFGFEGGARDAVGGYPGTVESAAAIESPGPPAGAWLTDGEFPDFRFKVRISPQGAAPIAGVQEGDCVPETLCVRGAIAGRSEVFLRVIGPRPNGFLWPTLVKFTPSQVEVWIEQLSTSEVKYYLLPGATPTYDVLPGLFDRNGFLP